MFQHALSREIITSILSFIGFGKSFSALQHLAHAITLTEIRHRIMHAQHHESTVFLWIIKLPTIYTIENHSKLFSVNLREGRKLNCFLLTSLFLTARRKQDIEKKRREMLTILNFQA